MITQSEKDSVLNTARSAYQTVFDFISAMSVEGPVPAVDPALQAQIDSLHAQVATQSAQLSTLQSEVDNLKISNASLQSKIDMVRAAIG